MRCKTVQTSMSSVRVNSRCFAQLSQASAIQSASCSGCEWMHSRRKFHETHDTAVSDEIYRLAREHSKLKEPWVFRQ